MKRKNIFYSFICVLLLSVCNVLCAEEITELEYEKLAMKFYSWEKGNENDSLVRQQIKNFNMERALESYSQNHEYTIMQDNYLQTYIQKILIIVKQNIYSNMSSYVIRYAHDVHNTFGCAVDIVSVNGESAPQIKTLIQTYATNLSGVVLVGDIIPAYYYHSVAPSWNEETFPCDLFYMDINGTWALKSDGSGVYDNHTGFVAPEIFVGRINTATMGRDEVQELKYYFDRNHQYWTGKKALNKQRALTFTETDWNYTDFWDKIAPLYGNNNYDVVKADMFYKTDYLNYLQNDNYEFIQLACHSWYYAHDFEVGGVHSTVYNYEISSLNTKQIGYNLFCCKGCKWTESYSSQCLGESYLYGQVNNSSALAVVGSAKTGGMLSFSDFYTPLGQGKCIGLAFKEWWISHCGNSHSDEKKRWFYGLTILGDPLLNFHFTNDCDEILYLNGGEETTNNMYYAQSKIEVQNYSLTQGQFVQLSAPTIQITGPFACNSSSTFIATPNDNCVCNNNRFSSEERNNKKQYSEVTSEHIRTYNLTAYPNPAKDLLIIDTNEELTLIVIYNQQGNYILQTKELNINVSHLTSGVYMIHALTTDGEMRKGKFIKL